MISKTVNNTPSRHLERSSNLLNCKRKNKKRKRKNHWGRILETCGPTNSIKHAQNNLKHLRESDPAKQFNTPENYSNIVQLKPKFSRLALVHITLYLVIFFFPSTRGTSKRLLCWNLVVAQKLIIVAHYYSSLCFVAPVTTGAIKFYVPFLVMHS